MKKKPRTAVLVLLNLLLPPVVCCGTYWLGMWNALVALPVFTGLAGINAYFGDKTCKTFLLNVCLLIVSILGAFMGAVLYVGFGDEAGEQAMMAASLLEMGCALVLTLVSTLMCWYRQSKGRKKLVIRVLAALAIGVLLTILLYAGEQFTGIRLVPEVSLSMPGLLLAVLVSIPLATVVHELGHLLLGLIGGYRFYAFRLGPVAWSMENGRVVFRRQQASGMGGACLMVPPEEDTQASRLAFMAGGVLANLLTGLVALALPLVGLPRQLALLFAALSILLAIGNALPFYSMGNATDGMQFWSQLFHTREGEWLAAAQQRSARLSAGIRPRKLKPLPPLPEKPKGIHLQSVLSGTYFRLLDGGDLGGAGEALNYLEDRLDEFPSLSKTALLYELCFYRGLMGERERAGDYRRQAGAALEKDGDLNGLRVKAYCAWYLDGDRASARELCRRALEVEAYFPIPGQALMEHDLIVQLYDQLS